MKKFALLLLLLLPGMVSRAQDSGTPEEELRLNSLKLYPFAFIKSRFAVSYERALGNRWSAQVVL